ncbi:Bug family tripartite tricarboxylate transporter substrate binding protein [Comamonas testosteroni]|uniref:Bug family tripartite tricarboxylate transporter substrate binding protein n=1 Tax=Comamonas testosteroni TaxID=285 RepID=UPI0005B3214D|nr:tripartite tricarboxylate transporter substrate binding protein [Comamonas testosteroni]
MKRRDFMAAGAFAGFAGGAGIAAAQAPYWPTRPLRLVVPFPPGGLIDRMARLVGPSLAQSLGQPVVVDNKPGAGGNLGAADVARAAADGYTLLMASPPLTISPAIYKSLPYPPQQIEPVALLGRVQNVLLVNARSPIRSVAQLGESAKARPGQMNYGSNGNGTSLHLCMELYKSISGAQITHVPYRGAAGAMTALLAGEVDVMFDNLPAALPHIRAGKIRALAVAARERSRALPDVPTMLEAGVPRFDVTAWFGIAAPAGLPGGVGERLRQVLADAVATPEIAQAMQNQGAEPYLLQQAMLRQFWAEDSARWSRLASTAGIAID